MTCANLWLTKPWYPTPFEVIHSPKGKPCQEKQGENGFYIAGAYALEGMSLLEA